MRQTEDGSITVLQGRNVGGSTVHNLCYAFRTPGPDPRASGARSTGSPRSRRRRSAPSFERVEQTLKVKPIREDEVNALNRDRARRRREARLLGLRDEAQPRGLRRSRATASSAAPTTRSSRCSSPTCPRPSALGARLYASARAERIEADPGAPRARVRRVTRPRAAAGRAARRALPRRGAGRGARRRRRRLAGPAAAQRPRERRRGQVGAQPPPPPLGHGGGLLRRAAPRLPRHSPELLRRRVHRPRARPALRLRADADRRLPGADRRAAAGLRPRALPLHAALRAHGRPARAAPRPERGQRRPGASPARPRIRYALEERDRAQLAEGLLHCVRGAARRRRARGAGALRARSARLLRPGDDLAAIRAARRGPGGPERDPDRFDPSRSRRCRMGGDPRASAWSASSASATRWPASSSPT